MSRFRYAGRDASGEPCAGEVVADDSDEAARSLRRRGVTVRTLSRLETRESKRPLTGVPEHLDNYRVEAVPGRARIALRQQKAALVLIPLFSGALGLAWYLEAGVVSYVLCGLFLIGCVLGAFQEEDWVLTPRGASRKRRFLSWTSSEVQHSGPLDFVARTTHVVRQSRTRYRLVVLAAGRETDLELRFTTGAALERCAELLEAALGREVRRESRDA